MSLFVYRKLGHAPSPYLEFKTQDFTVFNFCFIVLVIFMYSVCYLLALWLQLVYLTHAHITSLPDRLVASSSARLIGLGPACWLALT